MTFFCFFFFFFGGGGRWRDLLRSMVVGVFFPFCFALLKLLGYSELEVCQGCKRCPRYLHSCHPGKFVRPLVSRRPGVSFHRGNLRILVLVGEVGNHSLNLPSPLLAPSQTVLRGKLRWWSLSVLPYVGTGRFRTILTPL
jgi:hypothetical protein